MDLETLIPVPVPETDVTMFVRLKWGRFRKLMKQLQSATEADTPDIIDGILRESIADCRGLTEGGKPVQWAPEKLDDLPPTLVGQMFGALANLGEGGAPLAPTDAESSPAP